MTTEGVKAEKLFVDLCNRSYLKGFVFHSPRYYDPTEKEAGDVVLWVRRRAVVFEVVRRSSDANGTTKQFVKRIGEKRDQLFRDFRVFNDPQIDITMQNELGEVVAFDKPDVLPVNLFGVVIVDCDAELEPIHHGTIRKTLDGPLPVAVMTRRDFMDIVAEVDTIPDLVYYLSDRFRFLKEAFGHSPSPFLNLNNQTEKNLIAHYKMNRYSFSEDWSEQNAHGFAQVFETEWKDKREARDRENADSFVIDQIVEFIRSANRAEHPTLYHSWELASLSRRERASSVSAKIRDAFHQLCEEKPKRYFAFFNPTTGCWLVFLFRYGGDREAFADEIAALARQKAIVEAESTGFAYSVFGFGFRKSQIETGASFDNVELTIADVSDCIDASEPERAVAFETFGSWQPEKLAEFPEEF